MVTGYEREVYANVDKAATALRRIAATLEYDMRLRIALTMVSRPAHEQVVIDALVQEWEEAMRRA